MSSIDHSAGAARRLVRQEVGLNPASHESRASSVRASKLRPIAARVGIVRRSALLDLIDRSDAPVVTVVAPAGYGKTTVLRQWSEEASGPVAWLSTDDGDNDPVALCTGLAAALDLHSPLGPGLFAAVASRRSPVALATLLAQALASVIAPITLVIDQLEFVTNPECLDILRQMAVGLPVGARLILSSRVQPQLSTPRLRVQGELLEIGTRELALTVPEADGLLRAAGADLSETDVATLVERTEGWPAGVYLASVASTVGSSDSAAQFELRGDSRLVGDYLRDEVLDRLTSHDASFLRRASILETMSGAVCDAILDTTGSAALLERFEDRNLLVVPLDERREWYRLHRLLGELLRSELHRHEPELEPQLHARAAAWYQANGRLEHALRHAQAAKDQDRVALLMGELMQPLWARGGAATVRRWLEWFAEEDLLERYPAFTAHGALWYALLGYPAEAETWSNAAEHSDVSMVAADGSSTESTLAYMRAFLCRNGVAAMRSDSIVAFEGLAPTSPYRTSMVFTEGLASLMDGDPERAEDLLIRAANGATAIGAVPLAAMVFAVLGQLAADRDDWAGAIAYGDRASGLIADGTFDDYWSSAPVFAFGARTAIRTGQLDVARTRLARAAHLRPLLTYALPVMSVSTLLDMARAYLALTDRVGAVTVLQQAHGIIRQRPALGELASRADELSARAESSATIIAGGTSLTAAELRLAPFLATHLTLQEIGVRLYISRSTVKTQAVAIYHKLGAGSRSEAVDQLRELGLIGV